MATLSDKQIQICLAREVIMQSSSSTGSFPGLSSNEWLTNDDIAFKNKRPRFEFETEDEMKK